MARPKSEKPSCLPHLRGSSLSIRLSFGELKYLTPVLAKVEPEYVAKNGYVKPSHPEYVTLNETLAGATTRLEQAFNISQAAGELTAKRLRQEYLRLTSEDETSAKHSQARQQVAEKVEDFKRRLGNERRLLARVKNEDLDDHIERLEAQLADLRMRRDNLRRANNTYKEDLLATYLERYTTRKGVGTMAEKTLSSFRSTFNTLREFEAGTRIQDVDEAWLVRFQDWMVTTPANRPIYSITYKKDIKPGEKRRELGEVLYYKTGETRKNASVKTYIDRIQTCLRYYQLRPALLPPGVTISDSFKLYKFQLQGKEDNVVALEEAELFQLLNFKDFAMREQERAIDTLLFLSATSLRHCDLCKVIPTAVRDGVIHLVARKTRRHQIEVAIPLNVISKRILEKYSYDMRKCKIGYAAIVHRIHQVLNHNDGKTFPSLQEPHEVINYSGDKQVGGETTRANAIGTHSGRRTFINICLDYNVPINKIIGMTGHTDVNTLMIYANKRKDVKKHMQNIFQLPMYEEQDYAEALN